MTKLCKLYLILFNHINCQPICIYNPNVALCGNNFSVRTRENNCSAPFTFKESWGKESQKREGILCKRPYFIFTGSWKFKHTSLSLNHVDITYMHALFVWFHPSRFRISRPTAGDSLLVQKSACCG